MYYLLLYVATFTYPLKWFLKDLSSVFEGKARHDKQRLNLGTEEAETGDL